MNFVTYFWRISEGLDYFGTKFVLYEFLDIFLTDEIILVQNSYTMNFETFSWQMRLFWYKVCTLWVSWHISEGLDDFGTKFVLYEFHDTFLTDESILVQNSYFFTMCCNKPALTLLSSVMSNSYSKILWLLKISFEKTKTWMNQLDKRCCILHALNKREEIYLILIFWRQLLGSSVRKFSQDPNPQ